MDAWRNSGRNGRVAKIMEGSKHRKHGGQQTASDCSGLACSLDSGVRVVSNQVVTIWHMSLKSIST